jgi:hypothetical protein
LKKLKHIGVYDQTLLFVIADHGQHTGWQIYGQPSAGSGVHRIPMLDRMKTESMPLFLVKSFNAKGALRISNAPISLGDITKTIISQLEFGEETPGVSVFAIKDSDSRSRRFLHHDWEWDFWKDQNYEQPMKEYLILGYPWLDESWQSTNKVFTSGGVRNAATYKYGETIKFGEKGNYLAYHGEGWSCPDEEYTASERRIASITIPVVEVKSDIELKATFMTYIIPGKVDKQLVRVFCNDRKAGEWLITEQVAQEHSLLIPNQYVTGKSMKISFEMPHAVSPYSIGLGSDKRPLSIAMFSIVLAEILPSR